MLPHVGFQGGTQPLIQKVVFKHVGSGFGSHTLSNQSQDMLRNYQDIKHDSSKRKTNLPQNHYIINLKGIQTSTSQVEIVS